MQSAEDYATGKGTMGVWVTFALMVGNVISASYVVGNTAAIFEYDIAYLWTFYAYIFGWGLTTAYVSTYRAAAHYYGASSMGEAFRHFYSKRVSVCVNLAVLVAFMGALSAQTIVVSGLLRTLLGINEIASVILTIIVLTGIALLGGMKGMAKVNLLHTIVLAMSVLIVCISVYSLTSFNEVYTALAPEGVFKMIGGSRSTGYVISTILVQPFVCVVSALSVAGTYGAKTRKTATRAQIMVPIFAILFFGAVLLVAVAGRYLWPEMEPSSAWYGISAKFGPWMLALSSCGVLAASMSTAPSQIMLMSSSIVSIRNTFAQEKLEDKDELKLTKILVIVCGVVFQLLGLISKDIVNIMTNAYTVWAVAGLVFTLSLVWKRVTEQAVFSGMLGGIGVTAIWIVYNFIRPGHTPFNIPVATAAGAVSAGLVIIITLVTGKEKYSPSSQRIRIAKRSMREAEAKAGE
ncbi:MAG TPA: sodium:solute symporter family protein [Clostridiaceae bacterium]|nr:sodium:solute symporter family protein [Clostridiaceae bacterium]